MKKRHREPNARERIGLGLADMLPFLRCSKSALAMFETNQRSLATWPLIRIGAVEICLNKPGMEDIAAKAVQDGQEASNKALQKRHIQCSLAIARAKMQLEKMQQQYQTCLNMLHVAKWLPDVLPTLLPITEQRPEDLEWAALYGKVASGKMKACGIAKQQLLQIKIDALQLEVDRIQDLITVA